MTVTPGHTGRAGSTRTTGTSRGTTVRPVAVIPPGPLPADSLKLAQEAAAQLGWPGIVLPEMTLLGRKVHVVARLRLDVHAERIATGMDPVIDRATVSTWTWDEMSDSAPGQAVEIVGVIAVTRHWRTGLAQTSPFARYYDAAFVVPTTVALSADYINNCLPRARAFGIGLLTVDEEAMVERDLPSSTDRVMLADDAISRWMNELAYEQLLACEQAEPEVPAEA